MNGCRMMIPRLLNTLENVSRSKKSIEYVRRVHGVSNKTNMLCQPTLVKYHSVLAPQTRLEIRNSWSGPGFPFYGNFLCRIMSSDCKGSSNDPPPKKDKPKCGSTRHEPTKENKPCKETKPKYKKSSELTQSSQHSPDSLGKTERQTLQNFHEDCIDKINTQINDEIRSAYTYISMASFCTQDNVALFGFAKFFTHSYKEEIEHMEHLIQYLNKRGGQLKLTSIEAPSKQEWNSVEDLLTEALHMEKQLNEKLLKLHACASQHGDANLTDFLEGRYLQEQVDAIKTLADLLTTVRRTQLYLLDRDLMSGKFSMHGNDNGE